MRIGLCGAPLSGKTTLGAMLYTEFLKQGVEGAYLIDEYAKHHLAMGLPIKTEHDQRTISNRQMNREDFFEGAAFNPFICDSCVWLGKVYMDLNGWNSDEVYLKEMDSHTYDVTIYIPLQDVTGETSEFRVHDGMQSARIAYLIEQELLTKSGVIYAPVNYKDRDEWVKQFVKQWKEQSSGKCDKPARCAVQ
jgi:hypothetical protein